MNFWMHVYLSSSSVVKKMKKKETEEKWKKNQTMERFFLVEGENAHFYLRASKRGILKK